MVPSGSQLSAVLLIHQVLRILHGVGDTDKRLGLLKLLQRLLGTHVQSFLVGWRLKV